MDIIAHCRAAVKEPGSAFFIKRRAVFCQEPPHSDKQALCQSDTIAAPALCGQHPCPLSHRFAMPQPGLRHPASATLSLASCWPLPQQLLPVSATGGGRRRCPKGGATGVPGHFPLDAQGPTERKRAGLAYGGSGFWTRAPRQAAVNPDLRALLFPDRRNFARPAWA